MNPLGGTSIDEQLISCDLSRFRDLDGSDSRSITFFSDDFLRLADL